MTARGKPRFDLATLGELDARTLCGVDEAGRGPLAGPVFAAAVVLDPSRPIDGLRDSKKLNEVQRERLALEIKHKARAWSIAFASEQEIDAINILQATMLAMRRAVEGLTAMPSLALVDGNRCPVLTMPVHAVVKGDDLVPAISAASILAKTARDALLMELHEAYPGYGFDQHKGYPTALHLERLRQYGASPVHRRSFGPVRALMQDADQQKIQDRNQGQHQDGVAAGEPDLLLKP